MKMSTDWFRNETWNDAIEADFFAHLGRARSQRDQYLAIQAITIAEQQPLVALRLADIYFDTKKGSFDDLRALSARATAQLALDRVGDTVQTMKQILEIERLKPNQKTNTFTDFPFLVATRRIEIEYDAALATLDERQADAVFPISKFKWHAALALIYKGRSEIALSRKHASSALDAAEIKKSSFTFHQNLGLVGTEYKSVVKELRAIYA